MTASTPTPPDSGPAATRDAARTARRLTDGRLRPAGPPGAEGAGAAPTPGAADAPATRPPGEPADPSGPPGDAPSPATGQRGATETPAAGVSTDPARQTGPGGGGLTPTPDAPLTASAEPGRQAGPGGDRLTPTPDAPSTASAAPARQAGPGGDHPAPTPDAPLTASAEPGRQAGPAGDRLTPTPDAPSATPTSPKPVRLEREPAAPGLPTPPTPPTQTAHPDRAPGPSDPSRPAPAPGAAGLTRPTAPTAPARAGSGAPQAVKQVLGAGAPASPQASTGGAGVRGSLPSIGLSAAPQSTAPAGTRPPQTAPPAAPGDRSDAPGAAATTTSPASPAGARAPQADPGPAPGDRPGTPGSGPSAAQPATPAGTRPPQATPSAAPGDRSDAPGKRKPAPDGAVDFGWISGVRVEGVAVPVAASVPGAGPAGAAAGGAEAVGVSTRTPATRRRNVIGAETTGSIPVHLLFREEPEGSGGGGGGDGADDGGPATVPVPKPKVSAAARKKVPAPARTPARPAPTADPKLVERPGPVLPGWVGVVGGVLALVGCAAVVWWAGAVPEEAARMLRLPSRPYHGIPLAQWGLLALGVVTALFFLGGLGRGRVGYALVLTLFGDYRGTVRRTGLLWVSPLLLRRRVDVRLRHWRSEPLPAVDAKGTALDVVVLVVWRIRDTVRAALGVARHEEYLREQVEAAMARVLSQLPADAFHEDAPTLRDAEAVGEALTRVLSAECSPVGIDVFSAQPTRIEYAPEVAAAMQRRRIAAIDAKHRDSVLTSVVDAVDDVVHRLTSRGLVELDDYERKALVKDLTVAFYTGRTGPGEGA